MDPSLSSSLASTQPYPMIFAITQAPPPQNPKYLGSSLDIDAFMNQPGHTTIVNTIIDRNRETIIENFLRDNVVVFGFRRPSPLDTFDPSYPLFVRLPSTIGPFNPSDHFFILEGGHKMVQP